MPTSQLPSVGVSGIDKIVHIVIFFFLAILWQLVVFKKRGDRLNVKMSFLLLGAMFIFGILIEVLQGEVTVSRTANFYDVLADLLGAGIGVLVFQKVKHLFST
jgi:VanZ family protein